MSVFSITCFRLDFKALDLESPPIFSAPPFHRGTAILRSQIAHAIRILNKSSGNPFHLLQDVQDLSRFYYIGKWHDQKANEAFRSSDARAELVRTLDKLHATIDWRCLYSLAPSAHGNNPILPFTLSRAHAIMKANVVAIVRRNLASEDKAEFEKHMHRVKSSLEAFSGHKSATGWKLSGGSAKESQDEALWTGEQDERGEEFVALSGWTSIEKYNAYPAAVDYEEHAQVRGWTDHIERRIAQLVNLE